MHPYIRAKPKELDSIPIHQNIGCTLISKFVVDTCNVFAEFICNGNASHVLPLLKYILKYAVLNRMASAISNVATVAQWVNGIY